MLTVRCDQADDCDCDDCSHIENHQLHQGCAAVVCGYRKHWLGRKPYTVRCMDVKGDDDD